MKLLVSGYRNYNDYNLIKSEILKILYTKPEEEHTIMHGNCSGVDLISGRVAKENGWDVLVYVVEIWKSCRTSKKSTNDRRR